MQSKLKSCLNKIISNKSNLLESSLVSSRLPTLNNPHQGITCWPKIQVSRLKNQVPSLKIQGLTPPTGSLLLTLRKFTQNISSLILKEDELGWKNKITHLTACTFLAVK